MQRLKSTNFFCRSCSVDRCPRGRPAGRRHSRDLAAPAARPRAKKRLCGGKGLDRRRRDSRAQRQERGVSHAQATGSTHRRSSFSGLLTKKLTGWRTMVSEGQGSSGTVSPASHGSKSSGARITGMRSWTGATISLAAVVRICAGLDDAARPVFSPSLEQAALPRVDQPVPDVRLPRPVRDQAPAEHREAAAVLVQTDGRDFLAGCDVVARRRFDAGPIRLSQA